VNFMYLIDGIFVVKTKSIKRGMYCLVI